MLAVEAISKSFGGVAAVDGASFRVEPGEVLGLLGPNGAGKSTSIAMIAGLLPPDGGRVVLDGRAGPDDPELRALIGMAPQSIALYPDLTCRENLTFFGSLYGHGGRAVSVRVDELLDRVGLTERAGSRVDVLSGGMKRRLNLAAALVHDPKLLLLDEPTAGVDPHSRNALLDLVRELRAEGMAVLYTTHYMDEAQRVCDRIAVMDRGRVLASGTVDELIEAHGGDTVVRVTGAEGERVVHSAAPRSTVLELLADGSATGLRVDRPDLEGVFFSLTGRSLRDS